MSTQFFIGEKKLFILFLTQFILWKLGSMPRNLIIQNSQNVTKQLSKFCTIHSRHAH